MLVLDLVVWGLAVVLVGLAVAFRHKIDPGFIGIALVNMMGLSHALTNLVQFWTVLETSLGAIARIKDFSENTPMENKPDEIEDVQPEWPPQGRIEFDSVSARYRSVLVLGSSSCIP